MTSLLDTENQTIAGVSVGSLDARITDQQTREQVRRALEVVSAWEGLTLRISFTKADGCRWEQSE